MPTRLRSTPPSPPLPLPFPLPTEAAGVETKPAPLPVEAASRFRPVPSLGGYAPPFPPVPPRSHGVPLARAHENQQTSVARAPTNVGRTRAHARTGAAARSLARLRPSSASHVHVGGGRDPGEHKQTKRNALRTLRIPPPPLRSPLERLVCGRLPSPLQRRAAKVRSSQCGSCSCVAGTTLARRRGIRAGSTATAPSETSACVPPARPGWQALCTHTARMRASASARARVCGCRTLIGVRAWGMAACGCR